MAEIHQNIENVFHRCWTDEGQICEERCTEQMLAYIFSGEMIIYNQSQRVKVRKGEAALLRRNHLVRKIKQPADGEPFNGVFLHLEAPFLRRFSQQVGLPDIEPDRRLARQLYIPLPRNEFLKGYFLSLDQYFTDGQHPSSALMNLKLQEVVQILIEQEPRIVPILFDCVSDWKPDLAEFMNRNFTSDLTIEEFAHYTGRSLSTFKRDFADEFGGETPSRWIVRQRLELARNLLLGHVPPTEVCLKTGFKNLSHFSTAFKRQYGVAPTMLAKTV